MSSNDMKKPMHMIARTSHGRCVAGCSPEGPTRVVATMRSTLFQDVVSDFHLPRVIRTRVKLVGEA
ncbi:hypothetical protein [Nonomuraea rubra]|uniref:Uncharacterized protein n=1 Tax=Nonomuraea rubra TaxID=46180 RepID=A0A7X0U043_9ACTN|nr:hypothetical protein [Nonomuraea rubra]MBB6549974.1 hypothetical protein [Nonomuraea rubra]